MTAPALDGLAALLEKSPIIPTFKARDLLTLPGDVEAAYTHHVRSYLPLAPAAGADDTANVSAFEKRLLRLIREAKAPIGYVAAEYGHGKTSTGLFLWDRARQENMLAVPPFSLDRLDDLITAVAGWVRFQVERVAPGLGERVAADYEAYRTEGIEALAHQHAQQFKRAYEDVLAEFRELHQQGRLQSTADGLTYVNFLDTMTKRAKQAGFQGLLVVADEIQQYIEHTDVSSAAEPISKLFDLITTMLSRTGRLACGLILLLPNKELGLLNQQRGDLVQRMKANRLAIDLTQVYGPTFAADLWHRLAEVFRFEDIAADVIDDDALRALGEIAARTDLASGPRTVVDVFKIAASRYRDGATRPYGLLDLVGSFERGEVAFDGLSRIQLAVRQALSHDLVRGHPDRERAVRLMAAFPTTGLRLDLQTREGVREAVEDLQRLAGGELVAIRGGGYDHAGRAIEAGVTLIALRPIQEQVTWLKSTIRDFRRAYYLNSEEVHRLAVEAFQELLTTRLFPSPAWKVEREIEATALSQNAGVLLRGAFPSVARRFPERRIYCRILRPKEPPRDPLPPHDLLIDVALEVPSDLDVEAQRSRQGTLRWLGPSHVRLELNLLRRDPDAVYLDLNPGFEDIVAPYDVNPLLNLSLYAHLARTLASGAVPGAEEASVRDLFLPALQSAVIRDLFTPEIGQSSSPSINAADVRFFDALVQAMCEQTYSDRYVTLMVTGQWRKALEEYKGALHKLNNPYIQNGNEPFTGTKRDVAALLTRTNATVDNFIQTFPQLIKVETPFRGDAPGSVRFTLHPLEQRIIALVQAGKRVPRLNPRTRRTVEVPTISVADVHRALNTDGYLPDEVTAGLELLEARGMLEWDQANGRLALVEPDIPSLDIVRSAAEALAHRITVIQPLLSDTFRRMVEPQVSHLLRALGDSNRHFTGSQLLNAKRNLEQATAQLESELTQRRQEACERAAALTKPGPEMDLGRLLQLPATGGPVADQLNAVRSLLHASLLNLDKQAKDAREVAQAALGVLARKQASDAELSQAIVKLQEVEKALRTVAEQREVLRRRIDHYGAAAQALARAHELREQKLLPLGEPVAEQRAALEQWHARITELLAAERVDALTEVSAWQAQLMDIERAVSAYEQSLRDGFATRQQALRTIFTDHLKIPESRLPPSLVFNPADPDESYRLLADSLREVLRERRGRLLQQLRSIEDQARAQVRPDNLALLPPVERGIAERDMDEVVEQIQGLIERLEPALDVLSESIATAEPDAVADQVAEVTTLVAPVEVLWERVRALTRRLQSVALTPDEVCAHEVLLAHATGDEIDFGDYEQCLRDRLPTADPWALLRGLMQKSRARLRIRLVRE